MKNRFFSRNASNELGRRAIKKLATRFPVITALVCGALCNLVSAAPVVSQSPGDPMSADTTVNRSAPASPVPQVVVAVYLDSPDFTVLEMKYRVFFNKAETKRIPLEGYDLKAAFTDELMAALSEDTRMEWQLASSEEPIDVVGLMKRKVVMPSVDADRLLLVAIGGCGAIVADLAADKLLLSARLKLVDRASGRKLWEKKINERTDLPAKLAELQADNQKGLKEGLNKLIEQVCRQFVEDLRKAKL